MAGQKVKLKDQLGRVVRVGRDAAGATVGKDLRWPDGTVVKPTDIRNPSADTGSTGGLAATVWKLIREIPANIQKLAKLAGIGFTTRGGDGEWYQRSIAQGEGIAVTNGDGVAGDPTVALSELDNAGGGALQKTARDGYGRLAGTSAATTDDLAEGATNLYFTAARAAAAVPVHNDLSGLQGGASGEYYHLTAAERGRVPTAGGTTGQFWRGGGSGAYSNLLVGPMQVQTGNPGAGLSAPAYQLFTDNSAGTASVRALRGAASSSTGLVLQSANGGVAVDALFVNSDGKVGIGAVASTFQFEVTGSTAGAAFTRTGGGEPFIQLTDSLTSANGGQLRGIVTAPGVRFTNRASNTEFWRMAPNLLPGSDNAYTVGDATRRPTVLWAMSGTISTSDAREKTPLQPLTAAELAAAAQLGGEIGSYRWLAMIEAKGDGARRHFGMTVQRAIEIMLVHGLDPFAYGFICYDEWPELPEIRHEWPAQPQVVDDFGNLVREAVDAGFEVVQAHRPAGDRYSFRMDELLAFIARGLAHRLDGVEQRLTAAGL